MQVQIRHCDINAVSWSLRPFQVDSDDTEYTDVLGCPVLEMMHLGSHSSVRNFGVLASSRYSNRSLSLTLDACPPFDQFESPITSLSPSKNQRELFTTSPMASLEAVN